MKRKLTALLMASALAVSALAGCGSTSDEASSGEETAVQEETSEESKDASGSKEDGEAQETTGGGQEADTDEAQAEETAVQEDAQESDEGAGAAYDAAEIRVGSLTGPTTMGLVNLMKASDDGAATGNYTFTIGGSDVSEITALVAKGDLDIAMIPANVAATLYNNDAVDVTVIDINTLGVLYCITGDESITCVEDLAGRTVLTTGQGSTPEYALNYLISAYDVEDVTLEFYSQTEIVAMLEEDSSLISVLPQPFATSAMVQNGELLQAFSLTEAWDEVTEDGSMLITGATIVRTEYLEEHPEAVAVFLKEHAASAQAAADDVEGTAELVVSYGVLESAAIAAKALPYCNIVCITGDEMKEALSGYLATLYEQDPTAIGGAMPGDEFYYTGE